MVLPLASVAVAVLRIDLHEPRFAVAALARDQRASGSPEQIRDNIWPARPGGAAGWQEPLNRLELIILKRMHRENPLTPKEIAMKIHWLAALSATAIFAFAAQDRGRQDGARFDDNARQATQNWAITYLTTNHFEGRNPVLCEA
jgi:hypothetical protein